MSLQMCSLRLAVLCRVRVLCNSAHILIFGLPKMVVSSIMASTSSAELKKGNRLLKKLSKITPQDHMSISERLVMGASRDLLVVWLWHLKSTSGARKPLVPARFALFDGLLV